MKIEHTLTILFEAPFWIGLFEEIVDNQMQVCKVTFGAEPTEQEVLEFVDKNWNQLKYSRPIETELRQSPKNPKTPNEGSKKTNQEHRHRYQVATSPETTAGRE